MSRQTVRCGTNPDTVQCDMVCGKLLDCKEHMCKLVCHAGPCPSCEIPVDCKCYCGVKRDVLPCGKTKIAMCSRNPRLSSVKAVAAADPSLYNMDVIGDLDGLSDLSDFSEDEEEEEMGGNDTTDHNQMEPATPFKLMTAREAGVGGFSCGGVCDRLLSCGRHHCQQVCHPLNCGPCPYQVTEVGDMNR